jgi:hypothetical protein
VRGRYTVAMPRGRTSFGGAVILAASLTLASCGDDPPEKEIQQAQTAIDAAKAAGASDYSPAEFAGAEDALKRAREAVAERDYRLALTSAIDSRERAQSAAAQAAEQKAAARTDAERLMASTLLALSQARAKLKAAESARAPAKVVRAAQATLEQADTTVQEAGAAFQRGDYLVVRKTLDGLIARLSSISRDLESQAGSPPRRRR